MAPPALPLDCEPPGIEAFGLDDEGPPEELGSGIEGEGSDELEPERPPLEGDGKLGEVRPPEPPALPDDPPEDPPDDDGEEGEDGDGIEVDCWLAHPPMSNAETALTPAT